MILCLKLGYFLLALQLVHEVEFTLLLEFGIKVVA